ncbi:hypothetical protein Ddye_008774 [Dipteronia dyeriana]|uniref:Uncharacterized protein n=1 Tax=Dipteronia dyeriana TaxID=168575 RepID=A0AAE0CLM7_9ROSI|nr:hypothetical protein Ddye_008774 [Dipteronia dyeriana]
MGEQVEAPFTWVEEYSNPSYPPLTGSKRKVKSKKKEFLGWGSKPLIEFLHSIAKDITQQISRHDVTAIINRYVNDNNLVHPVKKKRINCDDKLHALFGRKSVARNKIHNMLEQHYAENLEKSDDDELVYSSEEDNNTCTNYQQQKTLTSERKTTPSKKRPLETPKTCFAAIITENVKLVYLKRSLVLDLLNDPDTFERKIVGSFVRIKSDPNNYLQKNYYCLMLVTGIKMVPGADDESTEILLRVANFFKDVPISLLSDDNFSEEECEDLRQRVKDGLLNKPTIVELEEKAQILHEDITKHWLVGELALLQKLIDRANEKGWRRELYEYLDRRQLLQTPAEQSRLLCEVPKVIEAIEQDAPEVIADAIEQEASEHDSPDGIKQGNNGSQVPILKETSEIPICDIAANGISSCFVSHNTEFTGIQAALSKSKQQTEPGILLDFSMGQQQKLLTEIRNESNVVPQPVTKEENKMAEVIELSDDDENEIPIFDFDLERLEWQYADPQGDIQGPFSITSLKRWSDADYFPPGFKVWKTGQRPDEAVLVCDLLQWAFPNNF